MTSDTRFTIDVAELGIGEQALNLFVDGFPREAIRHEAQDLLIELEERCDRQDMHGYDLVQHALADRSPLLALSALETLRDRDEHAAFRHLFLAVVRGVRNVYSHDVRSEVSEFDAVFWFAVMGRLRHQLDLAKPTDANIGSHAED